MFYDACRWEMTYSALVYLVLLILVSANDLGAEAWSLRRRGSAYKSAVSFPPGTQDLDIHKHFMRMALDEASRAATMNEVPIGALVVRNVTAAFFDANKSSNAKGDLIFEIISTGRNEVETKWDASAHAEMIALRQASRRVQNWRLLNCTLYSTLEPCVMCLAACQAFRLSHLVYGAPDLRLGAVQTHMRLLDIVHPFHNVSVTETGILAEDCAEIIKSFFRSRRKQKSWKETKNTSYRGKLMNFIGRLKRRFDDK